MCPGVNFKIEPSSVFHPQSGIAIRRQFPGRQLGMIGSRETERNPTGRLPYLLEPIHRLGGALILDRHLRREVGRFSLIQRFDAADYHA